MEQTMLDFTEASRRRDEGMKQAFDNAGKRWAILAMRHLECYLRNHEGVFMTEDVRRYAEQIGMPSPPSNRAWGSVMLKAARMGMIKKVGLRATVNPKAHRANASLWIKV